MFRLSSISRAALAAVCAASVFATTVAAQNATNEPGKIAAANKRQCGCPNWSGIAGFQAVWRKPSIASGENLSRTSLTPTALTG